MLDSDKLFVANLNKIILWDMEKMNTLHSDVPNLPIQSAVSQLYHWNAIKINYNNLRNLKIVPNLVAIFAEQKNNSHVESVNYVYWLVLALFIYNIVINIYL